MALTRDRIINALATLPPVLALFIITFQLYLGLPVEEIAGERLWLPVVIYALVFAGMAWLLWRPVAGLHFQSIFTLALGAYWMIRGDIPKHVFFSLLLLAASAVVSYYGIIRKRGSEGRYWILLVTIIVVAAFFLPDSESPIQWKLVKSFFAAVEKLATDISWQVDYALGGISGKSVETGYSDIGLISGGLGSSDRDDVYITGTGSARAMYVRGCSLTKPGPEGFSGKEDPALVYDTQLAVYLNALCHSGLDPRAIRCFNRIESATVTYGYIRTEDVLSATNTIWFDKKEEPAAGGGKDFSYILRFLTVDYAAPYFEKLISGAGSRSDYASFEELDTFTKEVFNVSLSKFMDAGEYDRALSGAGNYYNETYLDTDMATQRIVDLTKDIVQSTDSDHEKAKAIESFLRQYKYDTSVDLRESENYIDDFLFKTQRGYCVHYASSMVLMLRLCGIPAKYTLGYLHRDNDEHVIKSSEAHAWVQAYIDGIGWMDFEPTSAKETASALRWSPILPEDADESLYKEDDSKEQTSGILDIPEAATEVDGESENRQSAISESARRYLILLAAFIILAAAGIFGGRKLRYLMMDESGRVRSDMARLRRRLDKKLGVSPESIYDYLPGVEDTDKRAQLKEIFDTYYRIRFRGDEPDARYRRKLHDLGRHWCP